MNVRRATFLGMLVALAVALHLVEAQIPTPLPWVRPGLANLMTLIALLVLGVRAALAVAVLRACIGSLLLGGFLGPAFLLGLGGALAGTVVMAAMAPGAWKLWSPIAVSAAGAFAHGCAQVAIAAVLLLRVEDLLWLLPWVLFPGLLAGVATGALANLVLLRWQGYVQGVA